MRIAKNAGYCAMLQDILSPIIREISGKDSSVDKTAPSVVLTIQSNFDYPNPSGRSKMLNVQTSEKFV